MFEEINDILRTNNFNEEAIYGISGRALVEIVARVQAQNLYIEELEKQTPNREEVKEMQSAIDWYYNHRDRIKDGGL